LNPGGGTTEAKIGGERTQCPCDLTLPLIIFNATSRQSFNYIAIRMTSSVYSYYTTQSVYVRNFKHLNGLCFSNNCVSSVLCHGVQCVTACLLFARRPCIWTVKWTDDVFIFNVCYIVAATLTANFRDVDCIYAYVT